MSYFGDSATSIGKVKDTWRLMLDGILLQGDNRKRCLTLMAMSTGLRVDELIQQRWDFGWGDQRKDWVVIPAAIVKGKKRSRAVPYVQILKFELDLLERSSDYIFTGRKKWGKSSRKIIAITTRTAQRWIQQTAELSGLVGMEAHDLRRMWATMYYDKSGDFFGTMKVLGHQRAGTTFIYLIGHLQKIKKITEKLFKWII